MSHRFVGGATDFLQKNTRELFQLSAYLLQKANYLGFQGWQTLFKTNCDGDWDSRIVPKDLSYRNFVAAEFIDAIKELNRHI